MTPAVKAGKPALKKDYEETEIEGILFYIRKDLADLVFEINWVGFLFFGQFTVNEV